MEYLAPYKQGVRLMLHIQPRASRTKIVGIHGEAIKIAVQAPPVGGEANTAICEYLASFFDRAKRDVEILSGESGRKKSVYISGITPECAAKLLEAVLRK